MAKATQRSMGTLCEHVARLRRNDERLRSAAQTLARLPAAKRHAATQRVARLVQQNEHAKAALFDLVDAFCGRQRSG